MHCSLQPEAKRFSREKLWWPCWMKREQKTLAPFAKTKVLLSLLNNLAFGSCLFVLGYHAVSDEGFFWEISSSFFSSFFSSLHSKYFRQKKRMSAKMVIQVSLHPSSTCSQFFVICVVVFVVVVVGKGCHIPEMNKRLLF